MFSVTSCCFDQSGIAGRNEFPNMLGDFIKKEGSPNGVPSLGPVC